MTQTKTTATALGTGFRRLVASLAAAPIWMRYVGLGLFVAAAYYPALFQAARADQYIYLFSTTDKSDLFSLTLGNYSWNRQSNIGDLHFFRPVLFFLLGAERWAFGADNFFGWQATSL